ncbi:MFS transporter [Jiangella anatolica]|uniref:Multidrug efflux pump Tap n=1 Tax=Jiangella anatolica TaxID=2670374 RepID=A0A2W2BT47_9ACTN|nr:MFS transporter [Jiangella anatolica]PZF79319.1 hypothetical protein C1I92_31795 [Jiangella anatolica]
MVSETVPGSEAGTRSRIAPFVTAYAVTMFGDRFAEIALPVAVLMATGSPASAGAVAASVQVPGLLIAPFLGHWTDRHSRRSMLVWADAIRALSFAAFAFLATESSADLLPFLVIGAIVGCGNVLFGIAAQAVLPQLAQGPALGRANAVLEAADGVSTLAGPAVAGVAVARLGAAWGLAANAVSFVVSGLLLRRYLPRMDPPGQPGAESPRTMDIGTPRRLARTLRRRVVEPLSMVVSDRFQSLIQVALMALSAHGAALVLAVLVLGQDELELSVAQVGLVLSAAGVGGLLVSLVGARFPARLNQLWKVALSLLLSCAAGLTLAMSQSFWWMFVANGMLDAFVTAAFISTATVRQARTSNRVMGRVGAASAIANNLARVIGVAGAGVLLAAHGGRVVLVADAVMLGVAGLVLMIAGRRSRTPSASIGSPP